MEEEIDLRPFIEALLKNWKWIVISGIVAAVTTFIIVSARPATYSATAIIAVLDSGVTIELDEMIVAGEEYRPLKAVPNLATNNEVLSNVISQLSDPSFTISSLRNKLTAEAGADKTLVHLTVSAQTPEMAAEVANVWA
ncbi:MAG: hypothetical protein GY943_00455, partial [Chloroflexi bacterium]|nr:hypothetical protein [Chloroflexota bacterium]